MICLATKPVTTSTRKHNNVCHHFLWERAAGEESDSSHVRRSTEQHAHYLTKQLHAEAIRCCPNDMMNV